MKYLISAFVWMWGILLLLLMLVVINLLIFFPAQLIDPVIKAVVRIYLRLIGLKIKVNIPSDISPEGSYLFISNHVNIFDPMILYAYIPGFVRGVELGKHFRWPVYGWTLSRMGHIPIDQTNARSARESLKKAAELLRRGRSIAIMPEGHRTLDGNLRSFGRGAFILAKDAGRDIVPMAFKGAWEVTHKGSWMIAPGEITLEFGEVYPEAEWRGKSTNDLRASCRKKIEDLLRD